VAHWAPNDQNRRRFWAFWAYHIQKIRYDAPAGAPYLNLARLVARRPHFVITTNVDGQFTKAGFPPEVVFTRKATTGSYNARHRATTLSTTTKAWCGSSSRTRTGRTCWSVIPYPACPSCGGYLDRNLRRDESFCRISLYGWAGSLSGVSHRSASGKLVLLELGVVSILRGSSAGHSSASRSGTRTPSSFE